MEWKDVERARQREIEALLAGQVEEARALAAQLQHDAERAAERAADARRRLDAALRRQAEWLARMDG